MTARKPNIKPRGHKQERPSKDKLLALLSDGTPKTVAQLAKAIGKSPKCTRGHLEMLRTYGEVFRIDGTAPALWCNEPITLDQVPPKPEPLDMGGTFMRVIRPAGTWERNHCAPIAAASIFHMGGA